MARTMIRGFVLGLLASLASAGGVAANPPGRPDPRPAKVIVYALKCEVAQDGPGKFDDIDMWVQVDLRGKERLSQGRMTAGDTVYPNHEVEFRNRVDIWLVEKDKRKRWPPTKLFDKNENLGSVTIEMTPGDHEHRFTKYGAKYILYYTVVR